MKNKKILALLLTAMMVLATFLTGCSGGTSGDDQADKTLILGISSYTGVYNPIMSDKVYDTYVDDLVFEKLITTDATGLYVPASLTKDYTISDDKLTYTFTLKDGIKFSDGTPLTAEDVAFTYMTMADADYDGPRAYVVADMVGYDAYHDGSSDTFEGIKVIDDKTISFTFNEGKESAANISNFVYGILSKDYYKYSTWDEFLALNEKPMGSGVFVFDSWEPAQFIKFNKNKDYWDPDNAVKIDSLLFKECPSDSIVSALQTGEIDFGMPDASADNVSAIEAIDGVNLLSYLGNGYTFLCFNTLRDGISDVRVRQALMYALDRKAFIDACYGSDELASVGMAPFSKTSWAYPADDSVLNAYDFDLDKANSLLDEAGWTMGTDGYRYNADGKKLTLTWLVYNDSAWPGILSSMAADTWKQIGVDLVIDQMDFATVADRTMDSEERDFDIYTMGFSLDADPDPSGALFDADASGVGGFNASGYRNEEAQQMIYDGKKEFDQTKRAEIYQQFAKLMNEEIPTIIVAYRAEIWGINERVHGLDIGTFQDFTQVIRNVTLD